HGRLWHEVGLRVLAGGETADGPESQRDRRRRRQVRVRAQEVELQRVVDARDGTGRRFRFETDLAVTACRIRPRHVEEGSPRDGDEPPRGGGGPPGPSRRGAPGWARPPS